MPGLIAMADRILIVDDEQAILDLLKFVLENDGYEVFCAARGDTALKLCDKWIPDLVILDIGLPGLSGLEVCRRLHEDGIPVLVLSSHDRDDQIVEGLEEGADDYVTKPFNHRELLLRVEKLLNRAVWKYTPAQPTRRYETSPFRIRDLMINPDRAEVRRGNTAILLTPTELRILELLARTPGRPVDIGTILSEVWGNSDWKGGAEIVKVNILRLRRKLEPDPSNPVYLVNRRGLGYYLAET